jgi:hypothetical protein
LDASRHFVESEAGEIRIVVENQVEVPYTVLQQAASGHVPQLFFPIPLWCKVGISLRTALLGNQQFNPFILAGMLGHCVEGFLRIVIPKAMDPHQIKRIEEFA